MASFTVYARGDSATANNGYLNVENTNNTPTTQLEFQPLTSGGDTEMDFNGGGTDPDTVVVINGSTYSFTVEFKGTLPLTNKLSDVNGNDLRGQEVTVITAGGQRYVFLSDGSASQATMDAFPNGAHSLDGYTDWTTVICFAAGTLIRTPRGERLVETLEPGDLVTNGEGREVPLMWRSVSSFTPAEMIVNPALWPVRIARGSLGSGLPDRDLTVSAQHRVVIESPENELFFGTPKVLVPAIHLQARGITRLLPDQPIAYHHLLFERHETVFSNGLETESFQPSQRNLASLAPGARASFRAAVAPVVRQRLRERQDNCYSLRRWEAAALGDVSQVARVAVAA